MSPSVEDKETRTVSQIEDLKGSDMAQSDDNISESNGAALASVVPNGYFRSKLFLGTYFAQAVAVASGTGAFGVVAPLLNSINQDIGPDPDIVWVGYTYTLVLACTLTLIGRVSDLFGRRYVIVGGQILAMVGTIIASRASSVPMLIGAQAIIAVATSTQIAFQFVMGELVPIGKRFLVMGTLFVWTLPLGGFGTAFGLMFQMHTAVGWRGCYYLLTGLNAVAAILFFVFYYPPSFSEIETKKTKLQVLKEFDFVGFALFSGGFFVFLMGLTWGGVSHPWGSPQVIATIVIGITALAAFIAYEWLAPLPAPYMPFYLFRNLRWVCMVICLSIGANQFYALALVWPIMVKSVWPTTGDAYAWLASCIGGCLIGGQVCGGLLANVVSPRLILMTGTLVGTALIGGAACANEYNQTTVVALVVLGFLLIGLQEAICGTFCTIALKNQNDIGTGGGLAATIRSGFSALGSVIYGSVMRNTLSSEIPKVVLSAATGAGLPASSVPQLIAFLQGTGKPSAVAGLTPEILDIATHAYRHAASIAFRNVMLTSMAFGSISILCSWFAPTIDESKKNVVTRTLHKGGKVGGVTDETEKT